MSHVGAAIATGLVALGGFVTLVLLEPKSDAVPEEDLQIHVDDVSVSVPNGALTVEPDSDQDGWAMASLVLLTPGGNGITPWTEAWLTDDEGDYELGSQTAPEADLTLTGRVPSTFDSSSAALVLLFEGGLTLSVSLDGHEVGLDGVVGE